MTHGGVAGWGRLLEQRGRGEKETERGKSKDFYVGCLLRIVARLREKTERIRKKVDEILKKNLLCKT